MIILGISCFFHDSAACIVKDGEVVFAAAEERFTRKKHDNSFPENAIKACLDHLRIASNEVDIVVFYEKPIKKFSRVLHQHLEYFPKSLRVFVDSMGGWYQEKLRVKELLREKFHYVGEIYYLDHHLSHAASSFFFSGYEKASIVTVDGVGEWSTATMGLAENEDIRIDKEVHFPHSLGLLYSAITAYLGFRVNNDEYKVMGLASYGDPKPFKKHFKKLIKLFKDGSFSLNMDYFAYTWAERMFTEELEELFGYPARKKEEEIEDYHEDIAAALQETLEEAVFNLLKAAHERYKTDKVCLSGGVFLNSSMNGKILKNTPFKDFYITADPGDAGGALGAALFAYSKVSGDKPRGIFTPHLGPGYGDMDIKSVLDRNNLTYKHYPKKGDFLDKVVELLVDNKVVGWFQGRMEWGPRALGARSILADARDEKMRDIVNKKVKHREEFRPFAPAVLDEHFYNYFHADKPLPESSKYMLNVYKYKNRKRKEVPAVVHVDGTGRPQVVKRKDNKLYYDLIKKYYKKTGIPIILNTSFNVRGEPIVCTPEEGVRCFLGTNIDYLAIGNFLVSKD